MANPQAASILPPVGVGQELPCLFDLACDAESEQLPQQAIGHSSPDFVRGSHCRASKGRTHNQVFSPEGFNGQHSPETWNRLPSRDGRSTCSSRAAAALKLRTTSESVASCPTHLPTPVDGYGSRMDSHSPEGSWVRQTSSVARGGVHSSASHFSDSTSCLGPQTRGATQQSFGAGSHRGLPHEDSSRLGGATGSAASKRRILQPVLASKPIESSLGRPGAPPRKAHRRPLQTCEGWSELSQEFPSIASVESVNSAWERPKQSSHGCLATPYWDLETHEVFESQRPQVKAADPRAPSPFGLELTLQARTQIGRCSIFRSDYSTAVMQADDDGFEMAKNRRDAAKAAEERCLKQLSKFKANRDRNSQIHKLKAIVNDAEVRHLFEDGKMHQPKSQPYATPTAEFQRMNLDKQVVVAMEVEMPSSVSSRQVIEPPDGCKHDSKSQVKNLKHKRSLNARMRHLSKLAREKRRLPRRSGSGNVVLSQRLPLRSVDSGLDEDDDDDEDKDVDALYESQSGEEQHHRRSCSSVQSSTRRPPGSPSSPRERRKEDTDAMRVMREKAFSDQVSAYREKEWYVLREAFDKLDGDRSHSLDLAELRSCLLSIGLWGKNEKERRAIRDILWEIDKLQVDFEDFSELVPSVRKSLNELRNQRSAELFSFFNIYGEPCISIQDALNGLRRLGRTMREEFRDEVVKDFSYERGTEFLKGTTDPCLDQEGFVHFVSILQEHADRDNYEQFQRIIQKHFISQELQAQWEHDLVDLHAQFYEYEPVSGKYGSPSGALSEVQVITVLRETGYMPKSASRQNSLASMVQEMMGPDGTLSFMDFLAIMQKLREHDRERLRKIFETRKDWSQGYLSLDEIFEALPLCGLVPRNKEERYEVRALLEEFDEDGLGILSSDDCVVVCQQLARKFKLMQNERERQYVVSAGWTDKHFAEFRQAFWSLDEDMSEVLERDELTKAVELLRGSYWQTVGTLDSMLVALGMDPNKEVKVNFLVFLRMLKMLDDSESRRQQGQLLGFPQERTDAMYTFFQSLEPESDGRCSRALLEQVLKSVTISKIQQDELQRILKQEPLQVEFKAFLLLTKAIDGFSEVEIDDCLQEMKHWASEMGNATRTSDHAN